MQQRTIDTEVTKMKTLSHLHPQVTIQKLSSNFPIFLPMSCTCSRFEIKYYRRCAICAVSQQFFFFKLTLTCSIFIPQLVLRFLIIIITSNVPVTALREPKYLHCTNYLSICFDVLRIEQAQYMYAPFCAVQCLHIKCIMFEMCTQCRDVFLYFSRTIVGLCAF